VAPKHDGFRDFVLDQLSELPGLTHRAMFGGYGLCQHEIFFGIIHKGRPLQGTGHETIPTQRQTDTQILL
jgi:DNA transformation protein